jgi:hypothetical protein
MQRCATSIEKLIERRFFQFSLTIAYPSAPQTRARRRFVYPIAAIGDGDLTMLMGEMTTVVASNCRSVVVMKNKAGAARTLCVGFHTFVDLTQQLFRAAMAMIEDALDHFAHCKAVGEMSKRAERKLVFNGVDEQCSMLARLL